jgi:predicted DNA-binding protein with PD1-like motif
MESVQFGDRYVLRLDPGEEIQAVLKAFVEREKIQGGYFIAFGAFARVRLQYFDVESKQYRDNPVERQVEVVSLMGNIAVGPRGPILHVHGAFGDRDANTYSGHVAEGVVRPTLEVFLTKLGGELRREEDPATGLTLLSLAPATGEADRSSPVPSPYTP